MLAGISLATILSKIVGGSASARLYSMHAGPRWVRDRPPKRASSATRDATLPCVILRLTGQLPWQQPPRHLPLRGQRAGALLKARPAQDWCSATELKLLGPLLAPEGPCHLFSLLLLKSSLRSAHCGSCESWLVHALTVTGVREPGCRGHMGKCAKGGSTYICTAYSKLCTLAPYRLLCRLLTSVTSLHTPLPLYDNDRAQGYGHL